MTTETLNTGDVGRRMGLGAGITVELLESLGFKSVGKDKRAFLWDASDYPEMCRAVADYLTKRASVTDTPPRPPAKKKETAPAAGKASTRSFDDDEDDEL